MSTQQNNQITVQARGCGWPVAGGTYIHVPTGFYGKPIWNFLIDPTWPLPEGFSLSDLGMQMRPRMLPDGSQATETNGKPIYDLWDHIGSNHYPNPTDWIMEVAELGFHQLVSPNLQFDLMTQSTCYIAVHDRASIIESAPRYENRQGQGDDEQYPACPHNHESHTDGQPAMGTCPGLLFEDIQGGTIDAPGGHVKRTMPSFEYLGYSPITVSDHEAAAFFRLPIGQMMQILVYEDVENNKHENALEKLKALEEKLQRVKLVPFS